MKVILGLGNPGLEYSNTRHNCGFLVTQKVAAFCQIKLTKRCFRLYKSASCILNDESALLIQPLTYMNNSGEIIKDIQDFNKECLVVVCDQMDLPVGNIRIKKGGGSAGHNGLKSLISNLDGYTDFIRIYVGIGRPETGTTVVNHVLGVEQDFEGFKNGIDLAAAALIDIISSVPLDDVKQKYNKKNSIINK
ncbi:MAG: aminoacyl-tRNA hydrolase [Spirochaetaceae bacterium]|nr:aminoacyl-tRNA hydrolase [Spirochaetaceae bacterium]